MTDATPRDRYLAFRRSAGRPPAVVRQTLRVRGLAMAVRTTPPVRGAPPLLCINGGLLFDHRSLWPTLAPLAAGRQLVLYDQRGRGDSEAPAQPLEATVEDDAADVGALRRALGIRQWDVLGHSFGGGIAMLGTAGDVAGTRRLVLVDPVGVTSDWVAPLREAAVQRLDGEDLETVRRIDAAALADPDPDLQLEFAMAMHRAWFADPSLTELLPAVRAHSPTGAAVSARMRTAPYDWRSRVRGLSVPSLVIHGERDPLPLAAAQLVADTLPAARLAVIPGAGHMPFWESPESFFRLVDAFLTSPRPLAVSP
jgi:proline iminopeptidase